MQLGFIGLGKMGRGMVEKILQDGHEVTVWNRSSAPVEELKLKIKNEKLKISETIQELVKSLEKPHVIWSMLPQGDVTEKTLSEIGKFVQQNDIVIDGSNAHYKDTERRYHELRTKNIKFLGIGVAGGIIGPIEGYNMMAGGDRSAYDYIIPILDSLIKPNARHGYFGEGGAGHFVKMVHNGIEYGIMQSLAEGFDVLEHAPYKLDLLKVGQVWQKSSLVSGFMLDRVVEVLEKDPHLKKISGVIYFTGEGEWTIKQAQEEGVDVPIIKQSFAYRKQSQTDRKIQNSFTAKMVAALRHAFGGHGVKEK